MLFLLELIEGKFMSRIMSKMFPSSILIAYFTSMKLLRLFWEVSLPSFQLLKSLKSASLTASMLRPGEQMVTEGNDSSVAGLATSCGVE